MNKHSKVEDLNFLKIQTCVLKVSIHCEGCKKNVKKLLQKIDGVYTIAVDAEQGKVTVNGNVNPSTLIKKLNKAGKHAELWSAKKNGSGKMELHHQLPKLATDAAKGQQKPLKISEGKDQKLQQLQKELKDMNNLPFGKGEKSANFPVFDDDGSESDDDDDEFDADDDYFDDETDGSVEGFDDDKDDVNATNGAPKKIVTVKQDGGEVHTKSHGSGGTHGGSNIGVRQQGKGNGGANGAGNGGGKDEGKSHGFINVPISGGVPNGFFNKGTAAVQPLPGGVGYAYQQQQNMAEMMQQQRMMTNGYPMAYGYPIPRPESYTSYFSDENTSGGCSIM